MDITSIGAALSVVEGAEESAYAAAAAANEAAGLANQAKKDADDAASAANTAAGEASTAATNANNAKTAANNAATSATNAAAAANQAAANYSNLDKDAVIDRNAFNYAYTLLQAELRDVQKRLAAAEAALAVMLSLSMVGSLAKLEVFSENMRQLKNTVNELQTYLEIEELS